MARNDGVITLQQALAAGLTRHQVKGRLRTGRWTRLYPGVYVATDRAVDAAVTLRAAVHAAGDSAVAHGLSAAWWHGLLTHPPRLHYVTIPHSRRITKAEGRRIRHRDIHKHDVTTVRGLPVTGLPLTILEAAVDHPRGSVFLDRALQTHTTLDALRRVHERNRGRAGARAAEVLLQAAGEGGASAAERLLHRLLRRADIGGWQPHVRSIGYEIDVAFIRERVAIEVDGWAWHRDAARFRSDVDRQNALMNAGWLVLRFTWHHLANEPDRVLREIRSALARQGRL
ncbi:DUF559 domain-containing protein [Hoyosella sp. YIM 151337]|uniref:type IV toxin-antitoxin system AbiEi family antitoxin domain-containing protein n=1 Tax=Hoyosella sp. YIM 151337 TaxID=2992742 RepID=UPI0022357F39|nr:type IV toxin-antitoxin system AbiEi family antitoxin domain-containing protein [Hoyosella sp. YIM 151337]MCW4355781.1 DUF559 domain-containing protein [Hoyosella sp. YIM 151337]